ncbi:hypothetical protein [Rhodococcus koreensis]
MTLRHRTEEVDATVTEKVTLAPDVVGLTLAVGDGQEVPPWQAGAHIEVHCGNQRRQYSGAP